MKKNETSESTMGKNLIFLISQPRSGSTLLQHILGSHSQIHTLPEPWLMLHPVYALRSSGYNAEYQAKTAYLALEEFLENIPNGNQVYYEAIGKMISHIYQTSLNTVNKQFFLDKTPRY